MKEQITKFDLSDAFKALDDIQIPTVKGVRANRMDLKESTKRVDRLSMLVEDYYNIQDQAELENANNDLQADVAKAKLARIEKIVDLDASSADEILPSYVGKLIMQCPQCMTLFYKNQEDIEKSAEDPNLVNVGEICQHCGNDSGYNLIGKVAEETAEDEASLQTETEVTDEMEMPAIESEEANVEVGTEEIPVEAEETTETAEEELPEISEEEPEEKEEKKEESLHRSKVLKDAEKDIMNTKFHSDYLTLNEDLADSDEDITAEEKARFSNIASNTDACTRVRDYAKSANKDIIDFYDGTGSHIKRDPDKQYIEQEDELIELAIANPDKEYYYHTDNNDFVVNANGRGIKIPSNIKICMNESLTEDLNTDMVQFKAYIDYLQKLLDQDEKALDAAKKVKDNDLTISMLEKRIEADKAELDAALPQVVKDKQNEEELPTMEDIEETKDTNVNNVKQESLKEAKSTPSYFIGIVDEDGKTLINSDELKSYPNQKQLDEFIKKAKDYEAKGVKVAVDVFREDTGIEAGKSYYVCDKIIYTTPKYSNLDHRASILTQQESLNKSKFLKNATKDAMNTKFHSENLSLNEMVEAESDLKEARTGTGKLSKKYNTYTELTWALTGGKPYVAKCGGIGITGGPYEISNVGFNPRNNTITVYAEKPEDLQPAIEIANKFNKTVSDKDVEFDKHIAGAEKYFIKIKLTSEDFNDGAFEESVNRPEMDDYDMIRAGISEHRTINEAGKTFKDELGLKDNITDADMDKLFNSKEYKKPISDQEVEGYLESTNAKKIIATDIDDEKLNECISNYLNEVYSNVDNFKATNCAIRGKQVVIEGMINFKSGKKMDTAFKLTDSNNNTFRGINESFAKDTTFELKYIIENKTKIVPVSLSYKYKIDNTLVEGLVR